MKLKLMMVSLFCLAIAVNLDAEQLGDGTKVDRAIPVKIMDDVKFVSAGYDHTLIIRLDNSLWTTGTNEYGQLGNEINGALDTPAKVMEDVAAAAAGLRFSLILRTDGSLWGYGASGYGALGIGGDERTIETPTKIMDGVKSMSAGDNFSMILKADGSLWACGDNSRGQLGDGTKTIRKTPVFVMDHVVEVSAGEAHFLAKRTDGTIWTSGDNQFGQFGDGSVTSTLTPKKILNGDVKTVFAAYGTSFILKEDNTLWGSGANFFYQFGDGTRIEHRKWVKIMDNVESVSAGDYHTMILKRDGSLWGSGGGDNGGQQTNFGQLGIGSSVEQKTYVGVMTNVKQVSAGWVDTMILKSDNSLWACGWNGGISLNTPPSLERSSAILAANLPIMHRGLLDGHLLGSPSAGFAN